MSWPESLRPLRHPAFAWYLGSRTVNLLGTMASSVAIAFAVLDLGGSATSLGQVLAAHTIPMTAMLLFGGVLADRFPRALVLQVSNLSSALLQGATAILLLSGHAQLWMLIVLQALHGAANGVGFPAMAGMVPAVVPRAELQRANALVSMSRGLSAIAGPSLGTLVVVSAGSGWAVLADAATWLVAALLLLPVRRALGAVAAPPAGTRPSPLAELGEGWQLFRRTTWLWVVVAAFGVLNAIGSGAWMTLGPALAQETIGRQQWGWVLSAEAVGALAATVVLLRVPLPRPLLVGMICVGLLGLPMTMLGLDPGLVVLIAGAALAGVGLEVFGMGWNLAMQEHIPGSQLSRAYSYDALGSMVAVPIGQLLYGPLGDRFGYAPVVTVSGILYVLIALSVLFSRSVRTLDRVGAPQPEAVGAAGSS